MEHLPPLRPWKPEAVNSFILEVESWRVGQVDRRITPALWSGKLRHKRFPDSKLKSQATFYEGVPGTAPL